MAQSTRQFTNMYSSLYRFRCSVWGKTLLPLFQYPIDHSPGLLRCIYMYVRINGIRIGHALRLACFGYARRFDGSALTAVLTTGDAGKRCNLGSSRGRRKGALIQYRCARSRQVTLHVQGTYGAVSTMSVSL